MTQHYQIRCLATGQIFTDNGLLLQNENAPQAALLRAEFQETKFKVQEDNPGIFRFVNWLPVQRILKSPGYPVSWRSEKLAEHLGLKNLLLTFSGYWPALGAKMTTGTFKECEAYAVCARYPADSKNVLVVASAGNTARAFLKVAGENRIPLLVVVPQMSLPELWQETELKPWTKIVAAGGDSDYFDAIALSDKICQLEGYQAEGGAKNIARRDGMGTTVLSAVDQAKAIPDYYYQAIGSGTGAIAAYEANLRLLADGSFGSNLMQLRLSQNTPFLPIQKAWAAGSRQIEEMSTEEARSYSRQIKGKVLANRRPPYSLLGGLYDALKATNGTVAAVSNAELTAAQELFYDQEGCDIGPESGVALASLIKDLAEGAIDPAKMVMLNLTGGGRENIKNELELVIPQADLVFDPDNFSEAGLADECAGLRESILASLAAGQ